MPGGGLGVDAEGGPVVDPSKNVLDLVRAEAQRQDSLRAAAELLARERQDFVRREMEIRQAYNQREMEVREDFRKRIAVLRAEHWEKDLASEARRTDALRELDRSEVRTANDRHQAAVDTLAKTTAAMAETLRTGAENTAKNLAAQAEVIRRELDARITAVERVQAAGAGRGEGSKSNLALISSILAIIVMLITLGTFVFVTLRAPAPGYAPESPPAAAVPR
jgi:hypothetical protein